MKKYFLLAMVATMSLGGAVSCQEDVKQPLYPEVSVDLTDLSFGYEADFKEIKISSNREWTVSSDVNWLAFDPAEGGAVGETAEYTVVVTALENPVGNQRKATITVNTKAVYANAYVLQDLNPNRAPEDLYSIDFGKKLDGDNPYAGYSVCWYGDEYEAGFAAKTRKFYASNEKVTVRNSSSSNSNGYENASGLNHIHFGTGSAALALELPMHEDIRTVNVKFGILRNEYQASENYVNLEEFPVWVSKDGAKWMKLTDIKMTPTVPEKEKWVLCNTSITFAEVVEKFYLRFCPTVASSYRFDDLTVTASDKVGENPVDWTTAAEEFTLGTEVGFVSE